MFIDSWRNSVLPYRITDKFDELMTEVHKELDYLDSLEDWDLNDNKRYRMLNDILNLYEECQRTEISDI